MNKKLSKYINLILIFLTILFIFMLINNKKSSYNSKNMKKISLLKQLDENNNKLKELTLLKIKNVNILNDKNNEIISIKEEISKKSISSNEFKKIIYYLSEKAELSLIDIGEEQIIKSFQNFKLCYSSIEFKGSLVSLGRFLYFINKIDEYIDNSKFNMKLIGDKFIINLGYIRSDIE